MSFIGNTPLGLSNLLTSSPQNLKNAAPVQNVAIEHRVSASESMSFAVDDCSNCQQLSTNRATISSNSSPTTREDDTKIPKAFFCPLTLDVMFQPVLDSEGNSYERFALTQWLQTNETSPISRQPLSEDMLTPNIALRETIHEYMGREWVEFKTQEEKERWASFGGAGLLNSEIYNLRSKHNLTKQQHGSNSQETSRSGGQRYSNTSGGGITTTTTTLRRLTRCHRATVDLFLEYMHTRYGGVRLVLNTEGYCAFRFHDFFVVLHVPENVGVFCLYTRHLFFPTRITDQFMDAILQMNFLQASIRGGCLAMKTCMGEDFPEVIFSYTDRVAHISAQRFANVVMNFLQTAARIRTDLVHVEYAALSLLQLKNKNARECTAVVKVLEGD